MSPLGLVAGNGSLPLTLARTVKASGRPLVVVAHVGEADPEIEKWATSITWVKVGQVGRVLETLKAGGVQEAVMLGGITKTSWFDGARPDLLALKLLARVAIRTDDSMLRVLAAEFEANGVTIVSGVPWLGDARAPEGVMGKHSPTDDELADVRYGLELARGVGSFDIGQTVVVRERAPIAIEAIEGTDACIERGGKLAKKGAVVVKVVKPGQDERFDLPCAGPVTIRNCAKAGVRVLAVEAGGTLLVDREEMVKLADRAGIALVGVR